MAQNLIYQHFSNPKTWPLLINEYWPSNFYPIGRDAALLFSTDSSIEALCEFAEKLVNQAHSDVVDPTEKRFVSLITNADLLELQNSWCLRIYGYNWSTDHYHLLKQVEHAWQKLGDRQHAYLLRSNLGSRITLDTKLALKNRVKGGNDAL